jgi:hypothetical protein
MSSLFQWFLKIKGQHNKVNQTGLAALLVPLTLPQGRGRLFQRYAIEQG